MAMTWAKAAASVGTGACVELALAPRHEMPASEDGVVEAGVALRDSKNPGGPILYFTRAEMSAFFHGVRAGEFDHLL